MINKQVLLICNIAALVSGQTLAKIMEPRMSYASRVVHNYNGYDDQQAESSMSVNFPQQYISDRDGRGYSQQIDDPDNDIITHNPLKIMSSSNNNVFNVGYDISFNENSYVPPTKEVTSKQVQSKKFENAEVITGRRKSNEKVRAPTVDMSPQDFVSNALMKQRQLASKVTTSTTARHLAPSQMQYSQHPGQSATYSYSTQAVYQPVDSEVQETPSQAGYDSMNHWRNYEDQQKTSTVDIPQYEATQPWRIHNQHTIESKEPKSYRGSKYVNFNPSASNFNHEIALKSSEPFDFSNAHGEISYEEKSDNTASYSEHSNQYKSKESDEPITAPPANDISNINLEAFIPNNLKGVEPLQIDTSLVKDPVLTTSYQDPTKFTRVIPIHFDVRQIQNVMRQEMNKYQNYQPQNYQLQSPQKNYGKALKGINDHYDDNSKSASVNTFRVYGKPQPIDPNQYSVGFNYGRQPVNFEDDVYKIVSMRPPPPAPSKY